MSRICYLSDALCFDGCPIEVPACCVTYSGVNLPTIGVTSGMNLEEILEELSSLQQAAETVFVANTTNTVTSQVGGPEGHAPVYSVRLAPSANNILQISAVGLFVDRNASSDGKVKIDADDSKGYLEQKLEGGDEGQFVWSVKVGKRDGKITLVPGFDGGSLLNAINSNSVWRTQFCAALGPCYKEAL